MSYPKTAEEWWASAEADRNDLRNLVDNYYPRRGESESPHDMPITAKAAELTCEKVRAEIRKTSPADPAAEFDSALNGRDAMKMIDVLNGTWFGMPESRDVRSEPGFHVLCDLCSESYLVVEPSDESDDD